MLFCALSAGALAAASPAAARNPGDTYFYNIYPAGSLGGNTAYWDTTGQPYFAWYDQTTNAFNTTLFPPAGAVVNLAGSGTVGASSLSVSFNHVYASGTAGLYTLAIDSGNSLSQQSATSVMFVTGNLSKDPFSAPVVYGTEDVGANGVGGYFQSAGTNNCDILRVGLNAAGTGTYTLAGGNLLASNGMEVGSTGVGTFTQSGGSAQTTSLFVGRNLGSKGTYTLSGSGTVNVTSALSIGNAGNGTLNQTGGTLIAGTPNSGNDAMYLGRFAGGTGSWTMSGGTASVNGPMYVGGLGNGNFHLSGGAVHLAGQSLAGSPVVATLYVGAQGTAVASVAMDGGSLLVDGLEEVGSGGNGTFVQSGGTNKPAALFVGYSGSSGSMTLAGGLLSTPKTSVGANGFGAFIQSGGTHTAGTLSVGTAQYGNTNAAGVGSYALSNQTLQVGNERIGDGGSGTFVQTGGTHTIGSSGTGGLSLGVTATSQGSYLMQGGIMAAQGTAAIGFAGSGAFTQSGGTATFQVPSYGSGGLYVGDSAGSSGVLNLSGTGSTFQILPGGAEFIGYAGSGVVNQSAGSHAVGGNLTLANSVGSAGTYTLSGGTLAVTGGLTVGASGTSATFTQLGGSVAVSTNLTVALSANSRGSYAMSEGTTLSVSGSEVVGASGSGTFTQYGGVNSVGASLMVAQGAGGYNSVGAYSMYGGTLVVHAALGVGAYGTGTFTQVSGTVNVGSLTVGNSSAPVTGSYSMSNNASLTVAGNESIAGSATTGSNVSFAQYGGTHTIGGSLTLSSTGLLPAVMRLYASPNGNTLAAVNGATVGANCSLYNDGGAITFGNATNNLGLTLNGVYRQSDGQLQAFNGATVNSGGRFVINGGSATLAGYKYGGSLTIALGGSGTMTAGALTTTYAQVGQGGAGTWTQSGGVLQATSVTVGESSGSNVSTINLSGGSIASLGTTDVGFGLFAQSGGTHTAHDLYVGDPSSSLGQYNLSNGSLDVAGSERIGISGSGTFNQSGGTHTIGGTLTTRVNYSASGTVNLSGGVLSAAATVNNGTFKQTGGAASLGAVTGSGVLSVGGSGTMTVASFSQPSVTVSDGRLQVAAASSPFTNVATALSLSNSGVIDLNDHSLLTSSPASLVRQYLTDGYAGGAWNGTAAALVSGTAAQTPGTRTLGYATGGVDASAAAVPVGQTLVKYTVPGDADLSGVVDSNDFLALQADFGSAGDWAQGDFNYDGVVNFSDFLILQNGFGHSLSDGGSAAATPTLAVPEPGVMPLVVFALGGWLRRKRLERRR